MAAYRDGRASLAWVILTVMTRLLGAWRAAGVAILSVIAQVAAGYGGWPTVSEILFLLLAVILAALPLADSAKPIKKNASQTAR